MVVTFPVEIPCPRIDTLGTVPALQEIAALRSEGDPAMADRRALAERLLAGDGARPAGGVLQWGWPPGLRPALLRRCPPSRGVVSPIIPRSVKVRTAQVRVGTETLRALRRFLMFGGGEASSLW